MDYSSPVFNSERSRFYLLAQLLIQSLSFPNLKVNGSCGEENRSISRLETQFETQFETHFETQFETQFETHFVTHFVTQFETQFETHFET